MHNVHFVCGVKCLEVLLLWVVMSRQVVDTMVSPVGNEDKECLVGVAACFAQFYCATGELSVGMQKVRCVPSGEE